MRLTLSAVLLLLCASPVSASIIAGLFGTGVDGSGNPLGDGAPDTHYNITSSTAPAFPVPIGGSTPLTYADLSSVYAVYPGSYVGNSSTSQWIGPVTPVMSPSGSNWDGSFLYEIAFDLTGLDPSTASITGSWASDNDSRIYLNDNPTTYVKGENGYQSLESFAITSGFIAGLNKLQFLVFNAPLGSDGPNPTGLRVDGLAGTADPAAVPEPTSLLIWLTLATALTAATRHRSRR